MGACVPFGPLAIRAMHFFLVIACNAQHNFADFVEQRAMCHFETSQFVSRTLLTWRDVTYLYWPCVHAFIVFQMKLRCWISFIQTCTCSSYLHNSRYGKFHLVWMMRIIIRSWGQIQFSSTWFKYLFVFKVWNAGVENAVIRIVANNLCKFPWITKTPCCPQLHPYLAQFQTCIPSNMHSNLLIVKLHKHNHPLLQHKNMNPCY